jgi:hypothetical protein
MPFHCRYADSYIRPFLLTSSVHTSIQLEPVALIYYLLDVSDICNRQMYVFQYMYEMRTYTHLDVPRNPTGVVENIYCTYR